jgi:hypothetical protein
VTELEIERPDLARRTDVAPDPTRLAKFAAVLDLVVPPAIEGVGIALVRPDGYLALAASEGELRKVDSYPSRFAITRRGS